MRAQWVKYNETFIVGNKHRTVSNMVDAVKADPKSSCFLDFMLFTAFTQANYSLKVMFIKLRVIPYAQCREILKAIKIFTERLFIV